MYINLPLTITNKKLKYNDCKKETLKSIIHENQP